MYSHELSARHTSKSGDRAGVLVSAALKAADGDRAKALEIARSRDDGSTRDAEVIRRLEAGESPGNAYRVEIPEDSELLDFDKPMAQQPKQVRAAALRGLGETVHTIGRIAPRGAGAPVVVG